jgi:uncharacterized membrane protein YqjE
METTSVRGRVAAPTLADSLKRLTDGIARLLKEHLALFKEELKHDLKKAGRDAAMIAVALPGVVFGAGMLMVALALLLARWVGTAGGFAIVGGANLLGGAALAAIFGRKLAVTDRPLDRTAIQIKEDSQWLADLRKR